MCSLEPPALAWDFVVFIKIAAIKPLLDRGFNSPVQLYPRYDGLGNTAQVSLTVK